MPAGYWGFQSYWWMFKDNLSAVRQKGESHNGANKKRKYARFSEKQTFLTPLIRIRTFAYQGIKNFFFLKIWRALFSCNTLLKFALLAYCRRIVALNKLVFLVSYGC